MHWKSLDWVGHPRSIPATSAALLLAAAITVLSIPVAVLADKEVPAQLPDPDNQPPAKNKPVKVYILSGQSNMVGMGDISGGSARWGDEFSDVVVSVYPGNYSPEADYDAMEPTESIGPEKFGGVRPTPFPGNGTHVVRGFVQVKSTGVYRFKPGYAQSTANIMEVNGQEVHRCEAGGEPIYTPIQLAASKKVPFRITFLTDAANGLGWIQRLDIPGTLETLVKSNGKFSHLIDEEGRWTVRNDVLYRGVVTARGKGPLTVGLQGNTIGPELQFGHVMGYYHDEPVIIIKSSQGNRSLGWDFLPPGSKRFEHEGRVYAGYKDSPASWEKDSTPERINWYAGKQYDDCFQAVHEVLDNFATEFPQYKDQGFKIGGFVWWQGHKDGGEPYASRYEQNLVHFIKTLRQEFNAPEAPFVIATIGFGGWEMSGPHLTVANAQLAVSGETGKYPEFAGNVKTVETRDFWRDVSVSPRNQGYHYNRNAETYLLVGDALGRGMVELLNHSEK